MDVFSRKLSENWCQFGVKREHVGVKVLKFQRSLNVYINTKQMKNKKVSEKLNGRCASYIVYYSGLADGVFGYTANRLMNTVL